MTFLFIHGTFGSPSEAWFPWLKNELELSGHEVIAPQFPTDNWSEVSKLSVEAYTPTQSLDYWEKLFESILPKIIHQKELCVVAHSLGPIFALLMAEKYAVRVKKAYFVAPFLRPATDEELKDPSAALIHKANETFYHHDFDFSRIRSLIPRSIVICSDDDPNVHVWEAIEFAEKLESKTIKLSGLGHMGIESNLLTFPQLLDAINRDQT